MRYYVQTPKWGLCTNVAQLPMIVGVVGAVVLAFLVAYAAMFAFDKPKEILTNLQSNAKT